MGVRQYSVQELERLIKSRFLIVNNQLYRLYKSGWKVAKLSSTSTGYLRVGLLPNVQILVHRLVWTLCFGYPTEGEIDHIDGNKLNNHITNLRLVDRFQNQSNRKPNKLTQSGLKGVYKAGKSWAASISHQGRRYYLGTFPCPTLAAIAYDKKAAELDQKYRKGNYT